LVKTHAFYERHGGKTIVIAHFVPIVRTFAPFVAGIGTMSYPRFALYNVAGGAAWVAIGLGAGYAFGNMPAVRNNFSLVVLGIVFAPPPPSGTEARRPRPPAPWWGGAPTPRAPRAPPRRDAPRKGPISGLAHPWPMARRSP